MIFFAPFWIATCAAFGVLSQTPAVKALRDEDGREYDARMTEKAFEAAREVFYGRD